MKTKNLIAGLLAAVMLLCVGCSGGGTTTGGNDISGNTGGDAGTGEYISAKPLDISQLGDGYNPNYMPDAASIKQRSGTIHVVLDFDGTQVGWQKVAEEYERLHSGKVDVVINTDYSGTMYGEKIISELQNTPRPIGTSFRATSVAITLTPPVCTFPPFPIKTTNTAVQT